MGETRLGGKYSLVRLLGEGGMGSVWEARNEGTGKRVALKRMSERLSGDVEAARRFLREARLATRMEHPNVVEIFDVDTHEGVPFIVMEYLNGEPLSAVRHRLGRLEPAMAYELLLPAMHALGAAHRKKVVHRDLKPDNIFLAARGRRVVPKLLDFGISKALEEEELALTRTGQVMGTPYYMAPEQATGRKGIDHRADIYAMGVIFYEALTGRLPFVADNYNALIVMIASEDPTPIQEIDPKLNEGVADVVMRAMARRPEDRYATVAELGRELGRAVGRPELWDLAPESAPVPGANGAARPAPVETPDAFAQTAAPTEPDPVPAPPPATEPDPGPPMVESAEQVASPRPKPRPVVPIAGGLVLTGLLAATFAFVQYGSGEDEGSEPVAPPVETSDALPAIPDEPAGEPTPAEAAAACGDDDRCVVASLRDHADGERNLAWLVDALRRLDDFGARPAAERYVDRFPDGSRAADFHAYLAPVPSEEERVPVTAPRRGAGRRGDRATPTSDPPADTATPVSPPTPTGLQVDHRSGDLDATEF